MSAIKRVLIVDDLPAARLWLGKAASRIFTDAMIEFADTLAGGLQATMQPMELLPDIALIDLGLPDGNGVEIVSSLMTRAPKSLCVITTLFDDDAHLFPALRAGARGYVLKDESQERLMELLAGIQAGQPPLSASIARRILLQFSAHSGAEKVAKAADITPAPESSTHLTERETDTLKLIAKGLNVPKIAELLGLSKHTVAGYVRDVYRKLSINSRAEATVAAAQRGMLNLG
jgi:DNA-binding NarL/FixJ family response regulator